MYLFLSVEMSSVGAGVARDMQTNRQTDTHTQDKNRNPPVHAPRGLMITPRYNLQRSIIISKDYKYK